MISTLFEFEPFFEDADAVGLTSPNLIIGFFKGVPHPETIEHMAFHLSDLNELHEALAWLKKHDVAVEDPGDEIGPPFEGSKSLGLWFRDPDGYRWELLVTSPTATE